MDLTRRERILEAAVDVFAELGYAGASIREVARRAGTAAPTIYHHFECKEGLYEEVTAAGVARHRAMLEAALVEQGEPTDRLRTVLVVSVEFARRHRRLSQVVFALQSGAGPDSARARFHESIEPVRDMIRALYVSVLPTASDAAAAEVALTAQLFGLVQLAIADPVASEQVGVVERLVAIHIPQS